MSQVQLCNVWCWKIAENKNIDVQRSESVDDVAEAQIVACCEIRQTMSSILLHIGVFTLTIWLGPDTVVKAVAL